MKLKILVAEDDASLCKLYKTAFESRGFCVVTAQNGEEAITCAVKEIPDVIILDVMMPEIHGLNVLKILKADHRTKKIKTIMVTALDDQNTKRGALKTGACDFMVKSQSNISDIIKRIVEVTS